MALSREIKKKSGMSERFESSASHTFIEKNRKNGGDTAKNPLGEKRNTYLQKKTGNKPTAVQKEERTGTQQKFPGEI